MKEPCVYLIASAGLGPLYVGVTSDLLRRVGQHLEHETPGFASRYRCRKLVWFEQHSEMASAIAREKRIKGGSRARKLALIDAMNPHWIDLYPYLCGSLPFPEGIRIASIHS